MKSSDTSSMVLGKKKVSSGNKKAAKSKKVKLPYYKGLSSLLVNRKDEKQLIFIFKKIGVRSSDLYGSISMYTRIHRVHANQLTYLPKRDLNPLFNNDISHQKNDVPHLPVLTYSPTPRRL